MPGSRVFITRFFQLVAERQFTEAERMLERSKKRARKNEWNKGYFQALSGILLAQRSNDDRYLFLSNVNLTEDEGLKNYQRDFQEHTRNVTHADYDRGFFSAWSDYMRVLLKLSRDKKQTIRENQPAQATTEAQTTPKKIVQTKLL